MASGSTSCSESLSATSATHARRSHSSQEQDASFRSIILAVGSALALQFTAPTSFAKEADQVEHVSVERIVRDTHSYLLQVPDAERYRLRPSTDWVLKSQLPPAGSVVAAVPAQVAVPVAPTLMRRRFHAEIASAARKAGLDAALVHAVIGVESAYREHAVSPKGAVGLMQVMPDTGRRYGVENLTLPVQNISAGTRYLSDLMRLFNGDLRLVLAAYNAGENAVMRHGGRVPPYPETLRYVPRVLSIYKSLGGGTKAQTD